MTAWKASSHTNEKGRGINPEGWVGNQVFRFVLGRHANLKESSKSKELTELRLQVLVVVITSDACESKKEIMRLKSDLQSEGP